MRRCRHGKLFASGLAVRTLSSIVQAKAPTYTAREICVTQTLRVFTEICGIVFVTTRSCVRFSVLESPYQAPLLEAGAGTLS